MTLHCTVSFRLLPPCRGARGAGALTLHFVWHRPQAFCFERSRPEAMGAFAGVLAAGSAAPPGRRRPERQRRAKAEGKIKGRGTLACEKPVCTSGWRGTRQGVTACCQVVQCRAGMGETACLACWAATALDGATP
ncbi:hypothetical protein LMG18096_03345 [Ralstonia holmesii]|uniref:Uncharacterized protein n=1 Tax=Ralstonia holmesii TaxID=3058602 RepID=A0ABC8QI32_9RALS|nr:hypothetical protein LMG18096_03345 [Ralstonia sp. LMG 32967]